jgi:hypothetical protein
MMAPATEALQDLEKKMPSREKNVRIIIYVFNKQIFLKCLLYAKHCSLYTVRTERSPREDQTIYFNRKKASITVIESQR